MAKDEALKETDEQIDVTSKKEAGVLYLGIDLGTSRTAIAASNGLREQFPSYVGYPKDPIAMKLLKKDVLFGQEVLDNRLSLNDFRPVEVLKQTSLRNDWSDEELETNRKAARDLIHHAIRLSRPRKDELIYGVLGVPAQASIHNKSAIIDAAKDVLDSVMVCSEPFAVAYGMEMLTDTLVIDIGAGTTDLCRMHGTLPDPEDQITLHLAGDYVDQELFKNIKEACPEAQFTIHKVKGIKEKYSTISELRDKVKVTLPVAGKPNEFDITDPLRNACRSIVTGIIEAMENLIATFDPDFQEKIRNNVIIAGGGSQIMGLAEFFEEDLKAYGGGKVNCVEEPAYAGANGALKLAHDMPEEYWEELK